MADPYATCIRLTADITGFSSAMAIVTSTLLRTMGDVKRVGAAISTMMLRRKNIVKRYSVAPNNKFVTR